MRRGEKGCFILFAYLHVRRARENGKGKVSGRLFGTKIGEEDGWYREKRMLHAISFLLFFFVRAKSFIPPSFSFPVFFDVIVRPASLLPLWS